VTLPFPRFEKIKIIIQLKLQLMHIIWLFNPLCNWAIFSICDSKLLDFEVLEFLSLFSADSRK
jgi:hypothetical protein